MRSGPREDDTCRELVLPALESSGWEIDPGNPKAMVREQYYLRAATAAGAVRGVLDTKKGFVDYVLMAAPTVPGAVVEAKREWAKPGAGLEQAVEYASRLGLPLAYSTNGVGIVEHDLRTGAVREVSSFPTPVEVSLAYREHAGIDDDALVLLGQSFNREKHGADGSVHEPRWYQVEAVHRVLRAVAQGRTRILLLMATGTGKTFTAMQLVAKLRAYHEARRESFRVLYLADLDALLSQPIDKQFRPAFGSQPVARVKGGAVTLAKDIYFASYQALTTGSEDDESGVVESDDVTRLHDFAPDFFDMVIVDECHRGSAAETSRWRGILDRFSSAVQVGLTATPVQADDRDSYEYFGEPVFTYSLRQGIEDGYLAPYSVRKVLLTPDVEGVEVEAGDLDEVGVAIPEGTYTTRDFERTLSTPERTALMAKHLMGVLEKDLTARTVVFCRSIDHALDVQMALQNLYAERVDPGARDEQWSVRIVGAERNKQRLLERFCDPTTTSPVVATTSRLLSTGVDIEDLRYVVLFRPVGSDIEFKQIVGRGTRLYPDKGKTSFEVIDYVGASAHFNDPDFDGFVPVRTVVADPETGDETPIGGGDATSGPRVAEPDEGFDEGGSGDLSGVPEDENGRGDAAAGPDASAGEQPRMPVLPVRGDMAVLSDARFAVDTSTGRLALTEMEAYAGERVRRLVPDMKVLARRWARRQSRDELLADLRAQHVDIDAVRERFPEGTDDLDVLLQLAWNVETPTRSERVRRVREQRSEELQAMAEGARRVLEGLLDRYVDYGLDDITSPQVLTMEPLSHIGSAVEIARSFGGAEQWHAAEERLVEWLYSA